MHRKIVFPILKAINVTDYTGMIFLITLLKCPIKKIGLHNSKFVMFIFFIFNFFNQDTVYSFNKSQIFLNIVNQDM